jgi:hypothetical protein
MKLTLRQMGKEGFIIYLFLFILLIRWAQLLFAFQIDILLFQYFMMGAVSVIVLMISPEKIRKTKILVYFKLLVAWLPALVIQEVHDWVFNDG